MAAEVVIAAERLAKRYQLGRAVRHDTLRDALAQSARRLARFGRGAGPAARADGDFWALRDVSFEIGRGEVVGIIGRNGAGKSTLLKILSRITEPTEGRVTLRGRVASLLEVGTGFHPELSGRENVFLNGAILGMTRVEIQRKFDEIVAFAEVEQFLDTPVKHYSSGMYVRLAFAVAAHLEPEILIVDEVLAVGDAAFQRKCLGKIEQVAGGGRTVLFVSHNMNAVRELTHRALYLDRGQVRACGDTGQIVGNYLRDIGANGLMAKGDHASIRQAQLVDAAGRAIPGITGAETVAIELEVETDGHPTSSVECYLVDATGTKIAIASPCKFHNWYLPARGGVYRLRLPISVPNMASGSYLVDVCTVTKEKGFDHYFAGAISCAIASARRPGSWELKVEYGAGYLILDQRPPELL